MDGVTWMRAMAREESTLPLNGLPLNCAPLAIGHYVGLVLDRRFCLRMALLPWRAWYFQAMRDIKVEGGASHRDLSENFVVWARRPRYIRPRYMGGIPASTFNSRTHFQAHRVPEHAFGVRLGRASPALRFSCDWMT
jgi:hypothetical protein